MKSLSLLLRPGSLQSPYRRTYGNINMVKRKQLRRLKKINIYNRQISGQTNPNSWFTAKRLKASANHLQTVKNNHIGTNPIPPETQKEILKVMSQLSEYQYYNFRNRNEQLVQFKQFVDSCNIEECINKFPAKLRKDTQTAEPVPTPQLADPFLKYTQQVQVYMPQDQRHRFNILLKIEHPPKLKLQTQ